MNEQLKCLAFNAGFLGKKHNGDEFRWGHIDPELEEKLVKFADAIVRSCADICHNQALVQSEKGSLRATHREGALDDIGVEILYRFGLK